MDIMLWVLLSALICFCVLFLIWAVRGALITPVKSRRGSSLHMVVSVSGGIGCLEQTINGLLWLIRSGTLKCDIMIFDAGMDAEARTAAELMAKNDGRIHLCSGSICFSEDSWRTTDT